MIVKKKWLYIIILLIILIIYIFFGYIRGIQLTIVDGITKKPLENIIVYYQLRGLRSELLTFSGIGIRIFTETLVTDRNGMVNVKPRFFFKYLGEGFTDFIAINLDTKEIEFIYIDMVDGKFVYIPKSKNEDPAYNFFSNHSGCPKLYDSENMVFNPNTNYSGFVICNTSYDHSDEKVLKNEIYTLLWNDYSIDRLYKEKTTINLELKKK